MSHQPTPVKAPWEAEVELDGEAISALIAGRFPDLAGRAVERVGAGWDNDVWAVRETPADAAWLVRVPRRELGAGLLQIEAAVLPVVEVRVAQPCRVAVPGSVRLGPASTPCGSPDFPWDILAVRPVPGQEIGHIEAPSSARLSVARPLARFLRRLHTITPAEGVAIGAPRGPHGTLDPAVRTARVPLRIQQARQVALAVPPDVEAAFAADAETWAGLLPVERSLCHGDLHLRHVLVDRTGSQLCGIIDWGDVHVGDPAVDLAVVPMVLPESAWPVFFDEYGPVDDAAWRLARLRAWTASLALAVSCHHAGEPGVTREALAALTRLVATVSTGNPSQGTGRE